LINIEHEPWHTYGGLFLVIAGIPEYNQEEKDRGIACKYGDGAISGVYACCQRTRGFSSDLIIMQRASSPCTI
jgi:hypothetical protein